MRGKKQKSNKTREKTNLKQGKGNKQVRRGKQRRIKQDRQVRKTIIGEKEGKKILERSRK